MDLDGFLSALRVAKRSPATITSYRRELTHFTAFLKSRRLRISQVKPKTLVAYLQYRDPDNDVHPATTQRRLAALSTFFRYVAMSSNGRIRNPVPIVVRPRRQQPRPRPADPRAVDRLLNEVTSDRDRAMISVLVHGGLRLSELVSLDRSSIKVELSGGKGTTSRVQGVGTVIGKGSRQREFLLPLETLKALQGYLKGRTDQNPALFLSGRGKRMSGRTVDFTIRKWCTRLGLPVLHAHQFRSRYASNLHAMRLPLKDIAQLMGHSSVSTTDQYIQPDMAQIKAEFFAALESVPTTTQPRARHQVTDGEPDQPNASAERTSKSAARVSLLPGAQP